ncbi:MAG: DUF5050 domain-containing protein [Ruminococcus sp.]|nr:DUF5050 domain-containing protein [Ruminococcus sp.]
MNDIHKLIRDQIQEPIWDNWYIKEQIGSGASSVVYRIEARRENRIDVSALKIEPIVADEAVYVDEERRRDYLEKKRIEAENETTIMYKLRSSPNIVLYEDETIKPLIHEGRQIGYYMLIRMEYLTCLQKLMKERRFDCSQRNVLRLAIDIGSGIKAAHDLGVIHRDIKPGNFFVSDSGVYKLGDFNISKKSVSARSFAGTEGYIAPEIYYARYGSDGYTKQADIYSFGIALYCLMNDYQFPFGDVCLPEEAIERRMNGEELPPPKNASAGFAGIILKACAFNTNDRYQRMSDMLNDLKALEKGNAPVSQAGTAFADQVRPVNTNAYAAQPQSPYKAPVNNNMPQPSPAQYGQANMGYGTVYGQSAPPQYRKTSYEPEKERSGTALKVLLAVALVLVLAVLGLIIFFLVREDDDGGGSGSSSSKVKPAVTTTVQTTEEETTTTTTVTTTAETTTVVTTTRDTKVEFLQNSFDMKVGDTAVAQIKHYPYGSGAEDEMWRSTNTAVADVDDYGFITAVGAGKCEIIVSMENNPAAEGHIDINVSQDVTWPDQGGSSEGGASNIANGGYACSDGDKIYYSDASKFYSVKNGRSTVIGNYSAHYMNMVGNDIYLCNGSADNCICVVKRDGSDFRVLRNSYCYELTYYDGWLYFSEVDGNTNYICRMKPDGSEYTRLKQVKAWYMCLYAGNIYYVNYDNNYSLDVMPVSGGNNSTLIFFPTSDLCIAGGRLYYSSDRDLRWLYSINPDGSDMKLVRSEYTKHTNIMGDNIYCTDSSDHLVVMGLNGNSSKVYSELGYISFPVMTGSTLFTRGQNGETNIFSLE